MGLVKQLGAGVSLLVAVTSSANVMAGEAEAAFTKELVDCAAYYQIASDAISAMNAPQMQAVGDRLKLSGEKALQIAWQYNEKALVQDQLSQAKHKQQASLQGSTSLGSLMGRYKDTCKQILAEPGKRLDYWVMATL